MSPRGATPRQVKWVRHARIFQPRLGSQGGGTKAQCLPVQVAHRASAQPGTMVVSWALIANIQGYRVAHQALATDVDVS